METSTKRTAGAKNLAHNSPNHSQDRSAGHSQNSAPGTDGSRIDPRSTSRHPDGHSQPTKALNLKESQYIVDLRDKRPDPLTKIRAEVSLQAGIVSREQLLAFGWTDKRIRHYLRTHRMAKLLPGVYATFTGEPSLASWRWAACLGAGNDSYIAGISALHVYGYSIPTYPIIVATPHGTKRVSMSNIVTVRHRSFRKVRLVKNLPVTSPADALIDTTKHMKSPSKVRGLITSTVQQRIVDLGALKQAMRMRTIPNRWIFKEVTDLLSQGQTSILEVKGIRRIITAHGLPKGKAQVRISTDNIVRIVDYFYQTFGLILEFDGRLGHSDYDGICRDMERDNLSALSGNRTLRFGMTDVNERACEAASQVIYALRLGGWQGNPNPCGPNCRL